MKNIVLLLLIMFSPTLWSLEKIWTVNFPEEVEPSNDYMPVVHGEDGSAVFYSYGFIDDKESYLWVNSNGEIVLVAASSNAPVYVNNDFILIFVAGEGLTKYYPNGTSELVGTGKTDSNVETSYRSLQSPSFIAIQDSLNTWSNYRLNNSSTQSTLSTIPSNAVVIPSDSSGPVQIILESSEDMVNWNSANPGTYGASTNERFFRIRAVQDTE